MALIVDGEKAPEKFDDADLEGVTVQLTIGDGPAGFDDYESALDGEDATDIPTGYKHPAIQQQSRGVLLPRIVHIAGESPSSPRGGICTRNTQRCNSQAKEL